MERVLVIGCGGSGKTTFARRLAERSGLPLIHLDRLHWRPGWRATPQEAWRATVKEIVARERWIIEGHYGGTLDLRLPACDTVVFLDTPRHVCLTRVVWRTLRHRGRERRELAPGCPERLTLEFLVWIWGFGRRRRPLFERLAALRSDQRAVVLRTRDEIEQFLKGIPRAVLTVHATGDRLPPP